MDNDQKKRVEELVKEKIEIVSYDSKWPEMFEAEADFLRSKLPSSIIKRIEHFGSTAVPSLSAKPIIDMLVEVKSLKKVKKIIVILK